MKLRRGPPAEKRGGRGTLSWNGAGNTARQIDLARTRTGKNQNSNAWNATGIFAGIIGTR